MKEPTYFNDCFIIRTAAVTTTVVETMKCLCDGGECTAGVIDEEKEVGRPEDEEAGERGENSAAC